MRELLAMEPESSALHDNLGLVYLIDLGDCQQVLHHFATASELDSTYKDSRALLEEAMKR